LQFIALVLLNIELTVFNGGELSKLIGRNREGANKQEANESGGESSKVRGRISQGAKKPGGETAKGQNNQTPSTEIMDKKSIKNDSRLKVTSIKRKH